MEFSTGSSLRSQRHADLPVLIPTRRLAFVVALCAIPLVAFGSGPSWLIVNAVLVVGVLADRLLAPGKRSITIERELPDVLVLGATGELVWRITNKTRRAVTVALADDLAPSLGAVTRRMRARVPAQGVATATTTLSPSRRGDFTVVVVVVRIEGPMGLAARQFRHELPAKLRVFPLFKSRDEAELRINKARIVEVGLRSAQGLGGGTEFDQLREYTIDDEVRRMDWSATARTGKAIVRTYRAERNQVVISLLDNGRVMAGRVDGVPRVEHAMDAVMMLTTIAARLGDRAGLVAFDSRIRAVIPPSHGRIQIPRVTEAIYRLEPELAESDYRGAFVHTLSRFRRRAMLVIFTDLVEQAVNEMLVPALPVILRSHLVVVAAVQDPTVVEWALSTPVDAASAYRKVAAVAALEERRRTSARLSSLGVTVVDAPPGRMAPLLADTYLEVKARGRL